METDKEKCSGKVVHITNIKWDTLDVEECFLDLDELGLPEEVVVMVDSETVSYLNENTFDYELGYVDLLSVYYGGWQVLGLDVVVYDEDDPRVNKIDGRVERVDFVDIITNTN